MGDKHCGCEYCGSTDFNCNHCSADFSTAELAAELGQCLDCCKRVGELEAQLAECEQDINIAQIKAERDEYLRLLRECQRERDALREALPQADRLRLLARFLDSEFCYAGHSDEVARVLREWASRIDETLAATKGDDGD